MMLKVFLILTFLTTVILASLEFNRTPIVANGKLCYNGKRDPTKGCICEANYTG